MSIHVKIAGEWRQVSTDTDAVQCGQVKVDGTWRKVYDAYVKVGDTWQTVCHVPVVVPTPTPTPGGSCTCSSPYSCVAGVAAGFTDSTYSVPTEACTTSTGAAGTRTVAWTCNTGACCPDIQHAAGTCVATPTGGGGSTGGSTACCQNDDAATQYCNSSTNTYWRRRFDPCANTSCPDVNTGITCAVTPTPSGVNCNTVTSSLTGVLGVWPSCASGTGYYTVNYYDFSCPTTNVKVFESCYVAPTPTPTLDCTTCVYGTVTVSCGTYNNGTQSRCITNAGCADIYGPCTGDYNPTPTPTVNCNSCPYGSGYTSCGTYGNGTQYYCITPQGCADIYGACTGDYAPTPTPTPTGGGGCVSNAGTGCGRYGNGTVACDGTCSGDHCC